LAKKKEPFFLQGKLRSYRNTSVEKKGPIGKWGVTGGKKKKSYAHFFAKGKNKRGVYINLRGRGTSAICARKKGSRLGEGSGPSKKEKHPDRGHRCTVERRGLEKTAP